MPNDRDLPVLVIGAGLSGLAAALSLARTGVPVRVLEASAAVGGCCSTVQLSGYRFNNGAVYVAVPSLLRSAFARLGLDFDAQVPMQPIARPHQTHLDDGTAVHLVDAERSCVEGPQASARTAQLRKGLAALQRDWRPVYRALVEQVLPYEPSLLHTLSKLWRYLPRMRGQVDALIARHFTDPGLQAAVASTLLYTGTAPERLPASQIIGLIALLEEGFWLPRDGMGAISDALHRELQRCAVPIDCGRRVEQVEVDGDRVRGVLLADGERVAASQVVATGSGIELVGRLLPEHARPARMQRRARRASLSHRAISIQLGCDGSDIGDAFVVNHVPVMERQGRMHRTEPDVPRWLAYTCPTAVVPGLAPDGRSVIELFAPVSGIESVREWSREMTERAVDSHLAALRQRLPGLRVDTVRVLDPQDFAGQRHLYEGALYGIAPGAAPDKLFPHRSPLPGLYLAGQTTFPGYGVPSSVFSGIQAAEALAGDLG